MSSGIVDTIKKIALNAFEASSPVGVFYGEVVSENPVQIKISELLTLDQEFLVFVGEVSKGDKVSLIRCQGGQRYVVLGTRVVYETVSVYSGGEVVGSGNESWQYPFKNGYTKTSDFGWRRRKNGKEENHTGVDLVGLNSKHIFPVNNGTVAWVESSKTGYGNHLLIDHGNGIWSLYAHFSEIYVKAGQTVNKNTILGVEGSTGNSTGSHLHLEIRKSQNGSYVDPIKFLNGE